MGRQTLGFSPKRKPRPVYPPASGVIQNFALHVTRPTLISACITCAIAPCFLAVAGYLETAGFSEPFICAFFWSISHTICYVLVNLLFFEYGCDILGWFSRYKLDRKPIQIPKPQLRLATVVEAAVGQLILTPPLLYVTHSAWVYFGTPKASAALPGFGTLWCQYVVAQVFNDFFFYWSHRAFHITAVYPYVHKKHHTYTGSIGIAAEFAHPAETLISNTFPTVGGVLLLGCHPLVVTLWLTQRLQQTYEVHSGYCFYGSWLHKIGLTNAEGAAWHDYHHTGNQGNFGSMYLDWIFGTMDHFCELGGTKGYIDHCQQNRKPVLE